MKTPKNPTPKRGRPPEARVKMTVHVLPATFAAIQAKVDKSDPKANTQGKVMDGLLANPSE